MAAWYFTSPTHICVPAAAVAAAAAVGNAQRVGDVGGAAAVPRSDDISPAPQWILQERVHATATFKSSPASPATAAKVTHILESSESGSGEHEESASTDDDRFLEELNDSKSDEGSESGSA
ncbi:hypothetical protein ON010_g10783 [Phytophthora cinnamomi]|nr:hypothetical protein ON010_g10783 [Phytophthora cinnamomi]